MTKRDRVAIHAPLLRGYVLVRLSKSHTLPSPLSRCILNGITCTSIMDNAPICPVCQAELIPKVSGSATPNFDRAFLACPNDKPDNRHQGAFKWTEPPKHVPHDWPSCLCGVPAQIKKWGTTYKFCKGSNNQIVSRPIAPSIHVSQAHLPATTGISSNHFLSSVPGCSK